MGEERERRKTLNKYDGIEGDCEDMRKERKWKEVSSKKQIVKTLLIFVIPFVLFLFGYNVYTLGSMNEGLVETGKSLVRTYVTPVNTEIDAFGHSITDIIANDSDFKYFAYTNKQFEQYAYMQRLSEKIQRMFSTSMGVVGCLFYKEDSNLLREAYIDSEQYSYDEKYQLREILREAVDQKNGLGNEWNVWEIQGKCYLTRIFYQRDIYIMGVYSPEKTLYDINNETSDADAFLFLTDSNMNPVTSKERIQESGIHLKKNREEYYVSGSPYRFLLVQEAMNVVPLNVVYAVPYYGIWSKDNLVPVFFLLLSLILIVCMWTSYRMLEKKYLKPFENLIATMKKIESGNISTRMDTESHIFELRTLSEAFNQMMDKIKELRISSYESQIEMQQAKLQYLQIQIRPHFFLNCLKNLYGLAEEKKFPQIQKTILVLSDYLRYMMRDNFQMVPLKTELENVENYVLLQQLSSYRPISCQIEMEQSLESFELPPLSVLTFVENSVKHADALEKHLKIHIKIEKFEGDGETYVIVTILDNGTGFSEESLEELNGKEEYPYQNEHVGIQNVKHRFALIYKGKSVFLFSNMSGSGACIRIFIPVVNKEATDERFNY